MASADPSQGAFFIPSEPKSELQYAFLAFRVNESVMAQVLGRCRLLEPSAMKNDGDIG